MNKATKKLAANLVASCEGLLVEGVNTDNAVGRFRKSGGGIIAEVPVVQGSRCVYYISDYEWHSDSAPEGITTKIAVDVLVFDKKALLQAIDDGAEDIHILGTRMYDMGIWEDACHDFEFDVVPNVEIRVLIDYKAVTLAVDFDCPGPKRWTDSKLRSL